MCENFSEWKYDSTGTETNKREYIKLFLYRKCFGTPVGTISRTNDLLSGRRSLPARIEISNRNLEHYNLIEGTDITSHIHRHPAIDEVAIDTQTSKQNEPH